MSDYEEDDKELNIDSIYNQLLEEERVEEIMNDDVKIVIINTNEDYNIVDMEWDFVNRVMELSASEVVIIAYEEKEVDEVGVSISWDESADIDEVLDELDISEEETQWAYLSLSDIDELESIKEAFLDNPIYVEC